MYAHELMLSIPHANKEQYSNIGCTDGTMYYNVYSTVFLSLLWDAYHSRSELDFFFKPTINTVLLFYGGRSLSDAQ